MNFEKTAMNCTALFDKLHIINDYKNTVLSIFIK